MAELSIKGMDELVMKLNRTADRSAKLHDELLEAGSAEVVKAWKLIGESHGYRKSGDMLDSIGVKMAGKKVADIYPLGTDRRGVRNAYKAFLLHYGSSKIRGSHWVDEVAEEGSAAAAEVMQELLNANTGD